MKKQILLLTCGLYILAALSSCHWRHHYSSVTISDSRDEFRLCASYDRNKMHKLQRLLEEDLGEDNSRSFRHSRIDGDITLDEGTTFYMHSYPGELNITIDKDENSPESVQRIREACEDIKYLLGRN